jgi:hypothetical protein
MGAICIWPITTQLSKDLRQASKNKLEEKINNNSVERVFGPGGGSATELLL